MVDGTNEESIDALLEKCIGDESPKTEESSSTQPQSSLPNPDEIVSMRCLRHRRRFNVERRWLDTCSFLCPKCYERVPEAERARYAPKGKNGKRTSPVRVSTPKTHKPKPKPAKAKIEPPPPSQSDVIDVSCFRPEVASLIPLWRMECQKCHRELPVHKIWLDSTSKVLCPECYSSMTSHEVEIFHTTHLSCSARIWKVKAYEKPHSTYMPPIETTYRPPPKGSIADFAPVTSITKMRIKDLCKAVKAGKISKVRARIEMRRRRNALYYFDLPDVTPIGNPVFH